MTEIEQQIAQVKQDISDAIERIQNTETNEQAVMRMQNAFSAGMIYTLPLYGKALAVMYQNNAEAVTLLQNADVQQMAEDDFTKGAAAAWRRTLYREFGDPDQPATKFRAEAYDRSVDEGMFIAALWLETLVAPPKELDYDAARARIDAQLISPLYGYVQGNNEATFNWLKTQRNVLASPLEEQ
ncbi:hypothetical protein [Lacticaseibacillus mingshuiensis]|uniref:Uncharacterized protein n=1 Tax=Lacticaseibacillus mingshuiensis TaxID=2799574 RepID=A0ABW4CKX8_9LACO|nr:hypothetical protein [Lacticaseibacillus mingshuiensis]